MHAPLGVACSIYVRIISDNYAFVVPHSVVLRSSVDCITYYIYIVRYLSICQFVHAAPRHRTGKCVSGSRRASLAPCRPHRASGRLSRPPSWSTANRRHGTKKPVRASNVFISNKRTSSSSSLQKSQQYVSCVLNIFCFCVWNQYEELVTLRVANGLASRFRSKSASFRAAWTASHT